MLLVPLALAALLSGQSPPAAKEKAADGPVPQQKELLVPKAAPKPIITRSSSILGPVRGKPFIQIPFKAPAAPTANVTITTPKVKHPEDKQDALPILDFSLEYTLTPNAASEPLALRWKLEQLNTSTTPNSWMYKAGANQVYDMPLNKGFGPTGIHIDSVSLDQEPGTYRLTGWVTESMKENPGLTLSSVDLTFTVEP